MAWPPPTLPPPEEAEERELIAVEWLPVGVVWLAAVPCPTAVEATCSFCPALDEGLLMYTGLSAEPCWATLLEMWPSLPNVPRGTPSPAESLRKTNEFSFSLEATSGFSLTATMVGLSGWV